MRNLHNVLTFAGACRSADVTLDKYSSHTDAISLSPSLVDHPFLDSTGGAVDVLCVAEVVGGGVSQAVAPVAASELDLPLVGPG